MNSLLSVIQADLYRIVGCKKNWSVFVISTNLNFVFIFMRCTNYIIKGNKWRFIFKIFCHYLIKYGYEIPYLCDIQTGFKLIHLGGVVINPLTKIGRNVTLLRGCTIGSNRRGVRCGAPCIGDNVWIGANAAIIGMVTIGNDVMVAPNSYINFDVPSHSICLGNPAKIIHKENATDFYIDNPI